MLIIGHRGACGHAPENTLASFRKALELGVDGFEFDIQLSKDGEPMVIHDDTLNRTINAKGDVADFTYEELRKFTTKDGGEHIPHLDEIFELVDRRCELLIELKSPATKQVEKSIRSWVEKGWDYKKIWVLCFDHSELVAIRKLNANIQTGALLEGIPVTLAQVASDAGAQALCPYVGSMNQALVDDAHKRGLKVFTWTANKPGDITRAKSLGADGIMSDFPERL
jgi:glycerophosphoryl diester phosphodiesterase